MPLSREVKIAKKIKNNELGWCLGARLVKLHERVILILELDTFEGLPFALASTNGGGQLVKLSAS
jgi:hypothetical protein